MSDPEEQNAMSVVEKADDLIDLSEGGDLGSSLLDFQVDNAEVYAHTDGPTVSSEASEQSQQQIDLIDHFDVDVQFSEFREVTTDDELIEIHGGVELPDLPEISPSRLGIAELTTEDSQNHAVESTLPDISNEAAPIATADMDLRSEQVDLLTSSEPSVSLSTEPNPTAHVLPDAIDVTDDAKNLHALLPDIVSEGTAAASADVDLNPVVATSPREAEPNTFLTHENIADDAKDLQIRFMREIIQSVGDLLTDRVPGSTITVPDTFEEDSAGEMMTIFASIIAQLSANKTTSTASSATVKAKVASSKPESAVGSEQPAWADQQQQKAGSADGDSEWVENNDSQPAPDYGLESPVISHLLNTWTTDTSKIEFLKSWVRSLYMPAYESLNYPPGLQITNLSSVLRDGFVVLLVPLIRSLARPAVVVHIKRHLASQDRLARTSTDQTGRSASSDSEHSPTDPFASEVLFDIRIKRLDITLPADSGLHATTEEGYMSDNAAARQYYHSNQGANKFHVDSQYYSPLSEINSALPAIEEKTKRRVFDHAPKQDLDEIMTPPGRAGPRHKSFDRDYPGYSSFSRGVDAYSDRGPRSVSFSMPHVAPVPQPTLMESIYSWWGAAPAPAPAPVVCDVPPQAPKFSAEGLERRHTSPGLSSVPEESPRVPKTDTETEKGTTPAPRAESPYTSLSEIAAAEKSGRDSATSVPSSARASPALTPVNKIAERLQKIRDQKQTQV